jgi:hypothetical protein
MLRLKQTQRIVIARSGSDAAIPIELTHWLLQHRDAAGWGCFPDPSTDQLNATAAPSIEVAPAANLRFRYSR